MIDFIIKLEDMLNNAGYTDWEITYCPDLKGYFLKLDEDVIFMLDASTDVVARNQYKKLMKGEEK